MNEVIMKLNSLLALVYHMYFRAHAAHWNVTGPNFPQYHDFFGSIYETVFGEADDIAEEIRKLDSKPPMDLRSLLELAEVAQSEATDAIGYMEEIQALNDQIMDVLRETIRFADRDNEPATSNFLQDRLSAHQKIAWKLRSTLEYTP
jgi:starvation-inducible DNA-binding protein